MAYRTARIVIDGDLLRVYFDYNQDLVDDLKRRLPRHARWWDKTRRCWVVMLPWLDDLVEILDDYGYHVTTKEESSHRPPPPPPRQPPPTGHPLRLTAECFNELFHAYKADPQKLHHCLALGFHPDHHGGDGELMRFANAAYDRARRP